MSASASQLLNRLLARGKFRQLQILLRVAELGSLQRAGEAIGVSQSAVTQALAGLERLLDVPLFDRHARGARPTPACEALLPVVRQLLDGLAEGADLLAARAQRGRHLVRVAASVSAVHGLLVESLPRFAERHPGIDVRLVEAEGDAQMQAIASEAVDLVACRRPAVTPEGWAFTALRPDRLAVLCSAGHPLAAAVGAADAAVDADAADAAVDADASVAGTASPAGAVRWRDLAGFTWLLAPAGTAARDRFESLAADFGQPPRAHAVVTRSPTTIWWLLRHERVVAFLPLNFVRPLIDSGEVREIAVQPASPMEPLGLLSKLGKPSEAATTLAGYLIEHFAPSAATVLQGPTEETDR